MTTATAQDRLRQIAILISSVDASAARQILLHLPTDKARRVRELASQLGTVPADEKRKILAEFQRSAASKSNSSGSGISPGTNATRPTINEAAGYNTTNSRYEAAVDELAAQSMDRAAGGDVSHEFPMRGLPQGEHRRSGAWGVTAAGRGTGTEGAYPENNSWMHLKPAALVRFVRNERPAVTAVVISQLHPEVAVNVLQHLSPEISRDVLLRLARLQEIDPEAMQAIDEHLSQRLNEYQHNIESELENSRRIDSLLSVAPPHLREQWSAILSSEGSHQSATDIERDTHAQEDVTQPALQQQPAPQQQPEPTPSLDVLDIGSSVTTTIDESQILPFPQTANGAELSAVDRSLMQLEFEQILQLPPQTLASLLSNTDSQYVLLALAGATPQFMKRFLNMLDRQDAKALQSRLQRIGPIRLRDVDDAQRRIVENAAKLTKPPAATMNQDHVRRAAA